MRIFLLTMLALPSINLFAQECIPNPVKMSEDIISCLKQKDKKCITGKMISWQTVGGLYDSTIAKNKDNKEFLAALPSRDSIKADYESKAVSDVNTNLDSLFARGERIGINWNSISFEKEQSKVGKENQMANDVWFNNAKVKFGYGDSSYVVAYEALLSNGRWEIVDVRTFIEILDKADKPLGLMAEVYKDYAATYKNQETPTIDQTELALPPAPPKATGKSAVKKQVAPGKQPVKKPVKK